MEKACRNARGAGGGGGSVQEIVLPFPPVKGVEKTGVHDVAQILEAVAGERDLVQGEAAAGRRYLGSKLAQLGKVGGQRPAVPVEEGLVVDDADAGEEGRQQVDRAVVRDAVQAGDGIMVGEAVAGQVDQLIAEVLLPRRVHGGQVDVGHIAGAELAAEIGSGVVAVVGDHLDVDLRIGLVYLFDKVIHIRKEGYHGEGLVLRSGGGITAIAGGGNGEQAKQCQNE